MIEPGDRVRYGCSDWSMPGTVLKVWKIPFIPMQYVKVCFHLSEGTGIHTLWLLEVQLRKIDEQTIVSTGSDRAQEQED